MNINLLKDTSQVISFVLVYELLQIVLLFFVELALQLRHSHFLQLFQLLLGQRVGCVKLDHSGLLLTFKMLIVSLLHILNSLAKPGVPVIFDRIICSTNKFLGD